MVRRTSAITKRGRGRPRKNQVINTPFSSKQTRTLIDSNEFTIDEIKDAAKKTEKKQQKISTKQFGKRKRFTKDHIKGLFKAEELLIKRCGLEIHYDNDTLELLGETGEEPLNQLVKDHPEYLDYIIFGMVIFGAHIPLIGQIGNKLKDFNLNGKNKNQKTTILPAPTKAEQLMQKESLKQVQKNLKESGMTKEEYEKTFPNVKKLFGENWDTVKINENNTST